ETREAIRLLFDRYGYVACPHTAIAWQAADWYRAEHAGSYATVFLSTAHPCKFPEVFPDDIAARISIPSQVSQLEGREKQARPMDVDFGAFKRYLLDVS